MGYTHYYKMPAPTENLEKEYFRSLKEIKKLYKLLPSEFETAGITYDKPAVIRNYNGEGEPEFSDTNIIFNGDASEGLDHETFFFERKPFDFEFCKTARKPYDFFVCLCLISLANNINGFSFGSDGDMEDWEPAIEFYRKHIKKIKKSVLKEIE